MPQDRTTKLLPFAIGAGLAALVVCAAAPPARAGDDDSQDLSVTDKILKTFGIRDPNDVQYEINYSERSPLVVPPTRDLPPPASLSTVPAPNWPKDPDLRKRQQAKQDDKVTPRPYDSVMESERALRPDELGVGRPVTPPGTPEQTSPSKLGEKKSNWLNFDWAKKEEYGTFTGEPPRVSLTDPPPGYQTPSPDQPYGIAPDHKNTYKPPTLGERMEPTR
jgi:hypothetical protein